MTDATDAYFLLDNKFEMHVFKSYVFAIVTWEEKNGDQQWYFAIWNARKDRILVVAGIS